ncbi:DegT/DnrJ/EryC1/StrS family aminotransferase [Vibrio paracholerae]|nr:DegT/DnrJ/EryC1/StrS family aminotransferase [Vibrio paracholerae]
MHYPIPPHQQQAYAQWNLQSKPVTEMIHQQVLSLPLDPTMSDEQVQQVITVMNGFKA